MENEIKACRSCFIGNICRVRQPVAINGKIPGCGTYCVHYTCGLSGMLAARRAVNNGDFEQISLSDGTSVMAARFGTSHKPTQYPDSEFERLVTPDGRIITKTPDQKYVFSGQQLPRRKLAALSASSSN